MTLKTTTKPPVTSTRPKPVPKPEKTEQKVSPQDTLIREMEADEEVYKTIVRIVGQHLLAACTELRRMETMLKHVTEEENKSEPSEEPAATTPEPAATTPEPAAAKPPVKVKAKKMKKKK